VINNTIAKRYAKALVQIGSESGLIDSFRLELNAVNSVISADKEIQGFFANPAFTAEQKKDVMKQLIASTGCSELVSNFLMLLVDKNRQAFISQIVSNYETLSDEFSGLIRPCVTTAFALDDKQVESIKSALESKTGKKVIPQVDVDPSLIGGVVVQIGDMVYDSSVKTQLNRIQDILQKG
jgi:F-type H+-transporting ATPase subunit delta